MTGQTPEQMFEQLLRGETTLEKLESMAKTRAWLRTLHTRQLMNMRYTVFYAVPEGLTEADVRAMILAELDTREHAPNKIEARLARQARAKQSKSNRRSKA
jgi:hypothetical protein